ncbi:MAG: transcription antitermination factor NusB [Burkholderiaceae bacterium]
MLVNNKIGSRRLARKFIVQGIYQWLIASSQKEEIENFLSDQDSYVDCDDEYFKDCLNGSIKNAVNLREKFSPFLNDPLDRVSPVEHAVLLMATYELLYRPELPFQIILNEAVEVDKILGSNDGHKMINGVMSSVANSVRPKK